MAEFNPFEVPEDGPLEMSGAAPRPSKPPKASSASGEPDGPQVELVSDRPPKGGFGRFLRRSWKVIVAVVVLAAVLVVFSGAILARLAPAWTVEHGAAKAMAAVEARLDGTPWGAAGILAEALAKGAVGCEFDLTQSGESAAGSVVLTADWAARDFSLEAEYDVLGRGGDVALYLDRERAAVASSQLDEVYGVTFRSFEDDLRSSDLPRALGLDEEAIAQLAGGVERMTRLLELDPAGLLEELEDVYGNFLKDLEFEAAQEKTRVSGERLSCTAMTASVDERDLRNLVLDAYDVFTDNESVRSLLLASYTGGGLLEDEAEDYLDEGLREGRAQLKASLEQMDFDMDLTYYLYRGRLVKLEAERSMDGGAAFQCVLELGADPSEDDWRLACTADSGYGDTVRLTAVYESEQRGGGYSDRLTVTYGGDGYEETVELSTEWDQKSGDLELAVLSGAGEQARVRCNLTVDQGGFRLDLGDMLRELGGVDGSLAVWAEEGAQAAHPKFVNLDRWDTAVLEKIEGVLTQTGSAAYGY